jgi:hypothetical protein
MDLYLSDLERPGAGEGGVEIVERKGLGHPDTLCDALAEEFSRSLCRFHLDRFGEILHHNVDKVLLWGGAARSAFGGGEVLAPFEVFLSGRAIDAFEGVRVPVEELAVEGSRAVLGRAPARAERGEARPVPLPGPSRSERAGARPSPRPRQRHVLRRRLRPPLRPGTGRPGRGARAHLGVGAPRAPGGRGGREGDGSPARGADPPHDRLRVRGPALRRPRGLPREEARGRGARAGGGAPRDAARGRRGGQHGRRSRTR